MCISLAIKHLRETFATENTLGLFEMDDAALSCIYIWVSSSSKKNYHLSKRDTKFAHVQSIWIYNNLLIKPSCQTHGFAFIHCRGIFTITFTVFSRLFRSLSLPSEYYEKLLYLLYDMVNVYATYRPLERHKKHKSRSQPHFHLFHKYINRVRSQSSYIYTIPKNNVLHKPSWS